MYWIPQEEDEEARDKIINHRLRKKKNGTPSKTDSDSIMDYGDINNNEFRERKKNGKNSKRSRRK